MPFQMKWPPTPSFFKRDNFPPTRRDVIFREGSVVILGNKYDVSDRTIACQDHETYLDSITTVDSMFKLLVSSFCYSNIYYASSH
jgi:hypothetical protein